MLHAMMEGTEVQTPYYEIRKATFEHEKERIKWNLQPASFYSTGLSCTMLLISNLATPEWISVDCDEPLLDNIICVNDTFDKDLIITKSSSIFVCPADAILHGESCFKFKWLRNNNKNEELCQEDNMKMLSTNVDFKKEFNYIFEATSVIFPAVLQFDVSLTQVNVYNYEKQHNYLLWNHSKARFDHAKGIYICQGDAKIITLMHAYMNTFKCSSGEYISSSVLSDGINHCKDMSDELYLNKSKLANERHCPSLFTKDINGACSVYTKFKKKQVKLEYVDMNRSLIDDLVVDFLDAKDESSLKSILLNQSKYFCQDEGELPCRENHNKCYSISEICIYRLNELNHLIPCRTGNHLENCRDFECNGKFKCPGYYCLPWIYVNNGIWDCPEGHDEGHDLSNNCSLLFKCKMSSVCLALIDLCDGFSDCPMKDDELLCDLATIQCPKHCQCLLYAIQCHSLLMLDFLQTLPFLSVQLSQSNVNTLPKIFVIFMESLHINISNNYVDLLCEKELKEVHFLKLLDVSSNNIKTLHKHCVRNLTELTALFLQHNEIIGISDKCFVNLITLNLLDLSFNNLTYFLGNMFEGENRLTVLLLTGNPLLSIHQNMFQDLNVRYIQSDFFPMCCLVQNTATCDVQHFWFVTCDKLLPKFSILVCFLLISFIIISINAVSIFLHLFHKTGKKVYKINIIALSGTYSLVGMHFILLWMGHFLYEENIVLFESFWRSSIWCFASYIFSLLYHLLASCFLFILTLTRMILVLHPFTMSLERTEYVSKILFHIFLIVIAIVFGLAFVIKLSYGTFPSIYCSPTDDPMSSNLPIKLSTVLITLVQSLSSVCIFMFHVAIYFNLDCDVLKKTPLKSILVQLILLSVPNLLCSISSNTFYIVFLLQSRYSIEIMLWVTILVVPVNCTINPTVFVINQIRTKESGISMLKYSK